MSSALNASPLESSEEEDKLERIVYDTSFCPLVGVFLKPLFVNFALLVMGPGITRNRLVWLALAVQHPWLVLDRAKHARSVVTPFLNPGLLIPNNFLRIFS
jgi:hypothetical protein